MEYTLTPAYGRDYKSKDEVLKAWNGGKDFQIATFGGDCGRYCSIRDKLPGKHVKIRYNKKQDFILVELQHATPDKS